MHSANLMAHRLTILPLRGYPPYRRKAMLLSATSSEWGLLVKAMRQLTQSVKVVVSVSVMCVKCSRTIFSIVSNASLHWAGGQEGGKCVTAGQS